MRYFDQNLQAEAYARLIGRPAKSEKLEMRKARLALKHLQKLQKESGMDEKMLTGRGRTASTETLMTGIESVFTNMDMDSAWSCVSSEPVSPNMRPVSRIMRSLSAISQNSTNASDEGLRTTPAEVALSKASRSIFASLPDSDIKRSAMEQRSLEDNSGRSSNGEEVKVPLGLRRVLTSMLPGSENLSDNMVQELQAILASNEDRMNRC
jgi:hypothetical protein